MNTCSPSSAVGNRWKMPQPMRTDCPASGMGTDRSPLMALAAIHCPTQNTEVSYRPATIRSPRPVRSRWARAASTAMTP